MTTLTQAGLTDLSADALRRLISSDHGFTDQIRAELCRRHLVAEILFASDLQPSDHPNTDTVTRTIAQILRDHDCHWCEDRLAAEYGDHPDTAAARMRWALACECQLARDGHALASGGA